MITYSFETLCNDGRLAEFLELSGRILDKIDWGKEQIAQIKRRSEFLYHYLDLLCLQDHKTDKAYYYLSLYENNCEKKYDCIFGVFDSKCKCKLVFGKL